MKLANLKVIARSVNSPDFLEFENVKNVENKGDVVLLTFWGEETRYREVFLNTRNFTYIKVMQDGHHEVK